jgi:hypothetical protein
MALNRVFLNLGFIRLFIDLGQPLRTRAIFPTGSENTEKLKEPDKKKFLQQGKGLWKDRKDYQEDRLDKRRGSFDGPEDLAEHHDRYLYR